MEQFLAGSALFFSGLYAGGAWYLAAIELPSLRSCSAEEAHALWIESVRRTPRYAVTALLAAAAGLVAGHCAMASLWSWGAVTIFSVLPFTAFIILPVQRHLRRFESQIRWISELERWSRLHWLRAGLGLGAHGLFIWAALGR